MHWAWGFISLVVVESPRGLITEGAVEPLAIVRDFNPSKNSRAGVYGGVAGKLSEPKTSRPRARVHQLAQSFHTNSRMLARMVSLRVQGTPRFLVTVLRDYTLSRQPSIPARRA